MFATPWQKRYMFASEAVYRRLESPADLQSMLYSMMLLHQ